MRQGTALQPIQLKLGHVNPLISIRLVIHSNPVEYELILNEVQEHLKYLENLGANVQAWGELLLSTVTSKFDSGLLDDWERYVSTLSLKKKQVNRLMTDLSSSFGDESRLVHRMLERQIMLSLLLL